MKKTTQSKLFYTKSGAKILLVEENKISCWNSEDISLCFTVQGNFVGVSDDDKVINVRLFPQLQIPTSLL
jgi:hypothetical protein